MYKQLNCDASSKEICNDLKKDEISNTERAMELFGGRASGWVSKWLNYVGQPNQLR